MTSAQPLPRLQTRAGDSIVSVLLWDRRLRTVTVTLASGVTESFMVDQVEALDGQDRDEALARLADMVTDEWGQLTRSR